MRAFHSKITIFFLLQAIVLVAYNKLVSTPIWLSSDFNVLFDAHKLNLNPEILLGNIKMLFSQPLLQLLFLLEYRLFGTDPTGYLLVNLIIHAFNSFIVFMLVNMLFPNKKMSLLASVLFAFSVGHYGKQYMSITGQEALLMSTLHMLVIYFVIRNDTKKEGRLLTFWFLASLFLFVAAGLTKPQLFSILVCIIAYKFFFYRNREGRSVFSTDLVVLMWVGVTFYICQIFWGWNSASINFGDKGVFNFSLYFIKNLFRYLNLMVFPVQPSAVLHSNNPVVVFVYEWRTIIRTIVSLSILSFGFFGIIFGSRSLRFFIAWTVLTLLPFAAMSQSTDWLNVQYLYLGAVGFCVILSSGTMGCVGLMKKHRWKKLVIFIPAIFYLLVSYKITVVMNKRHLQFSENKTIVEQKELFLEKILEVDGK